MIPTQRHPAADWPEAQRRRWEQINFCPCGVAIAFNKPHCDDDECRRAHNTAERLLDRNGDHDA
jgi:hypothetical protein